MELYEESESELLWFEKVGPGFGCISPEQVSITDSHRGQPFWPLSDRMKVIFTSRYDMSNMRFTKRTFAMYFASGLQRCFEKCTLVVTFPVETTFM